MTTPLSWTAETSGVLEPVVLAYLEGSELNPAELEIMRAYLKQWIDAPVWEGGEELIGLRRDLPALTNRSDLDEWMERAMDLGIDPL